MAKINKFSKQDKVNILNTLREGKVQTISKSILGNQKTIQVGSKVDDKVKVKNTKSFEEFKQIYKNTIDDRCMQDYGSIDDKKLWEDCAKEMYLQSENYIPSDEDKPVEDLDSKQLKKESKKYKISDQEINDLYDRMRDFAKNQLKIENETQLDNYMKENMSLWIEIYQDLHSCNVTENCKDIKTESKQTNIEELKEDILSCDFIDYIQEIVDNLQDEKLKQKCNDCIQQLTKWFGTPKNSKQLEPYKVCLYRILDTYKMEENVQKQANLTDGVKKQIAEQYIEENKEALEQCKGLKDIINNNLQTICNKYNVLQPVGKDICAYIYNILNSKK